MELHELRSMSRAFDGLSVKHVALMARSVDMASHVARWQYVCMLNGMAVAEADGWHTPAVAAALREEVEAELKVLADKANAVAARERREIERLGQHCRAKDQYARVERTLEDKHEASEVEGLPDWFEALPGYSEKLAAIRADRLGDWDAFNAWLRAEYDPSDLADFTFEDEEDLDLVRAQTDHTRVKPCVCALKPSLL